MLGRCSRAKEAGFSQRGMGCKTSRCMAWVPYRCGCYLPLATGGILCAQQHGWTAATCAMAATLVLRNTLSRERRLSIKHFLSSGVVAVMNNGPYAYKKELN